MNARRNRRSTLSLVLLAGLTLGALAAARLASDGTDTPGAKPTASTPTKGAPTASPLAELGFLAGAWRGDMSGGVAEEVWSAPVGSSIMGCFRWLKPDQTPSMFEILTITREGEATVLRLRHYSPKLVAKEEKDKPLALTLTESGPTRAVFTAEKDGAGDLNAVRYELRDGALHIDVEFVQGEKPRPALKFKLARV
ncbi:MAG: DUF6265 family protein [Phycisphaerales bacterium]